MIALLQFSLVMGTAVFRFRWAICLLFAFLAFSPRSLGLILGGGSLSMTFLRLTYPLLLGLFAVAIVMDRRPHETIKPALHRFTFFWFLAALSIYKILTTLVNGLVPLYAVEDLLLSTVAFAFFYALSTERLLRGVMMVILASVLVTAVLVTLEMGLKQPLHYPLANKVLLAEDFLAGPRERDGGYRVQGIFDNPLSLSEFTVMMLPAILYLVATLKRDGRRLAILGLLACVWIILGTASRSGILVGIIGSLSFLLCYFWARFQRPSRRFLLFVFSVFGIYTVATSFGFLLSLIDIAQNTKIFRLERTEGSTLFRALQYLEVYQLVRDRPLAGFGVLQNFGHQIEELRSLDNYYLRLALEAGIPEIVIFIAFEISLFLMLSRLARRAGNSRETRALHAAAVGLLSAFAFVKLFVSIPTNNIYFYTLMGTLVGVLARRGNEREGNDAGSAGP